MQLNLDTFKIAAAEYARELSATSIPSLWGVTDGKAVGTYVEAQFNIYLDERFDYRPGNAAKGIDFPDLNVDLKVTSTRQPQSSCPFRDATQKVYGLGYDLIVFVYEKTDDSTVNAARLNVLNVVFIDQQYTSDYQTTRGILRILDNDANIDDLDAFLQERNLPLDDIGRRTLAERILGEPPVQGSLTMSNALQWRLQYGRAIALSRDDVPGVKDLIKNV